MKYSTLFLILLSTVLLSFTTSGFAEEPAVNWDAFSENLVIAIKTGNPGLQQSAMQRIIQYADKLNVEDAVWHIAQIFRFDDNPRVRRLALVTLFKINSDKAMNYVSSYIKYEHEKCLKKQGCCILQTYAVAKQLKKQDMVASK